MTNDLTINDIEIMLRQGVVAPPEVQFGGGVILLLDCSPAMRERIMGGEFDDPMFTGHVLLPARVLDMEQEDIAPATDDPDTDNRPAFFFRLLGEYKTDPPPPDPDPLPFEF